MKLDPINTILGNTVGVVEVNIPVRSNGGLIGVVLESGEVNTRGIGQVLSVDAKRPIENGTKGLGLAFMIRVFMIWIFMILVEAVSMEMRVGRCSC